jgi:hypothetical protein
MSAVDRDATEPLIGSARKAPCACHHADTAAGFSAVAAARRRGGIKQGRGSAEGDCDRPDRQRRDEPVDERARR